MRFVAAVASMLCVMWAGAPAHASVASDQARIVEIQRRIASEGEHVRSLVARENRTQARVDALNRQVDAGEEQVARGRRRERAAQQRLQAIAVQAYVSDAGSDSSLVDILGSSDDVTSLLRRRRYAGAIGDHLATAVAEMKSARADVERDVRGLRDAKDNAAHALKQLRHEHRSASAAIAEEQKTLVHVKADLQQQLAAEREAAQLATERALAKYPWPTKGGPLPPIPPATPGSYADPLRAIHGLIPERIDMGVDYAGYGPIYAIGDGIVLTTTVPGWPGGTMICYQLTDGPANGLVVFAAEDIAPLVHVGDTVTANTVLGLMYLGPDGIETGWGDPAVIGNALAGDAHQFDGANTTAYGANFSELLQWLGAPPGIPQNDPPTGTLPANWPRWVGRPPPGR